VQQRSYRVPTTAFGFSSAYKKLDAKCLKRHEKLCAALQEHLLCKKAKSEKLHRWEKSRMICQFRNKISDLKKENTEYFKKQAEQVAENDKFNRRLYDRNQFLLVG